MLLIFITLSIITILLARGINFRERVNVFSKGAGHKDLLMMVWIFVLAGAFASSAKAMGAVDATVNLALQVLPASFLLQDCLSPHAWYRCVWVLAWERLWPSCPLQPPWQIRWKYPSL